MKKCKTHIHNFSENQVLKAWYLKKKHEKSNNKKGHFFWPRVYERGIFGDLMLPGIACGIKKILLIFNTNINTPHDPIYIIDPSTFNIQPDQKYPNIFAEVQWCQVYCMWRWLCWLDNDIYRFCDITAYKSHYISMNFDEER